MATKATDRETCDILVAEDDVALRQSIAELVSSGQNVVQEAADGSVALDLLQRSHFDVLILDLHMPRLDGLELLRLLDAPPPAIIIYSAYEYFDEKRLQAELGFKVFRSFRKPVPPRDLISTVEEACQR